jgi:hypothetical protein
MINSQQLEKSAMHFVHLLESLCPGTFVTHIVSDDAGSRRCFLTLIVEEDPSFEKETLDE